MFRKKDKDKDSDLKAKDHSEVPSATTTEKTKQEIYHEQGLMGLFHTMKENMKKEDTQDLDDDIINLFG